MIFYDPLTSVRKSVVGRCLMGLCMKKVIILLAVCLAVSPFDAYSMDDMYGQIKEHTIQECLNNPTSYGLIRKFISLVSGNGMIYFNLASNENLLDMVEKLSPKEFPRKGRLQTFSRRASVSSISVSSADDKKETLSKYGSNFIPKRFASALDVEVFQAIFEPKFHENCGKLEKGLALYIEQIVKAFHWLETITTDSDTKDVIIKDIKDCESCINTLITLRVHGDTSYKTALAKFREKQQAFNDERLITFAAMMFYILYNAINDAGIMFKFVKRSIE